jgi:hypothetical protein
LLSHLDTTDNARKMFDAWSRIGPCIFHCHAACTGYDFSRDMSGLSGIGENSLFQILSTLLDATEDGFLLEEFAAAGLQPAGKLTSLGKVTLKRRFWKSLNVVWAQNIATKKNVSSLDHSGFAEATDFTNRHAAGLVNPRT